MSDLPHDDYMAAVAHALAAAGAKPREYWTETPDGEQLDAVFRGWPAGTVNEDEWPDGVYLAWDQYRGWLLIEEDGGRNVDDLSEDSRIFCDPRQVAADTVARLTHGMNGWTPGPICIDGDRWDTKATYEAVEAWQAG
ncbi:hypothetical protein ACWY4P_53410 (plasmid) [Streptomyces sp. LZ34]